MMCEEIGVKNDCDRAILRSVVRGGKGRRKVFVIGGVQIYAAALPIADRFYLTRVEHTYEGDTRFPDWNPAEWRLVASERCEHGAEYPYPFVFEVYERR